MPPKKKADTSDKTDLSRGFEQARIDPSTREKYEQEVRDAALALADTAHRRGLEEELPFVLDVMFGEEDIEYCKQEKPTKQEVERGHKVSPRRRLV